MRQVVTPDVKDSDPGAFCPANPSQSNYNAAELCRPGRTGQHGRAGKVKELANELEAFISVQKQRAHHNLRNQPMVLHMIFKGNPGTGKRRWRACSANSHELGVLPKGHIVEVERADLVGEYIGHTAQSPGKGARAMGGVLFIDEAYSLARAAKGFRQGSRGYPGQGHGRLQNEFILILAGYTAPMEEFLRLNPGLRSRFPIQLHFPDYSVQELLR